MTDSCKHELPPGECSICNDDRRIYITAGGSHYHWFRDCKALDSGQMEAAVRGDTLHPIERTLLVNAITRGRAECRTCRGHQRQG